jgi:type VI secretion system secreted protein Hcp
MGIFRRGRDRNKQVQPKATVLDFFLKIDGIEGESEDKTHAKEIRVLDFDFMARNRGASAIGKGGGTVDFQDVGFVMELDKALIGALQAGATGKHISSAVFTARKAGGGQQDYLKWTFSDFIISMVRISDTGPDSPVMAFVSLNFAKVEVEYREQKADGTLGSPVRGEFDLGKKA